MKLNAEQQSKVQLSTTNPAKIAPAEPFIGRKPTTPLLATPMAARRPIQPMTKMNRVVVANPVAAVEVKKISTGLMLAQCYNSETDEEEEEEENSTGKSAKPVEVPAVIYGK